ncbi:MAG: hypothetical protein BGN88_09745 [Clostridiales bacterium 43-6]|nr:MAG: hypothetical protein BGN88_09745 [Clostridiales bacterium 43-6]
MFEVVILTVMSELTQNEFDTLLPLISLEKQERIRKFHFFQDARNCLLGDVLARVEICRATGLSNKHLEFSVNSYGKPFLADSSHVYFNISHAGHYITCVIADESVGIDIELIKPVNLIIAERFFTPDETEYVMAGDYTFRFYEVWTKKESRIKWEGKGLHKTLPSFSVFEPNEQITYYEAFHNDEAICHVCSKKQIAPSVRVSDVTTFIRSIVFSYEQNLD